jgi:nucleoside-diphosphate-sugar epimerase
VIELSSSAAGDSVVEFHLGEEIPADRLSGIDVLVHTAHDFGPLEWESIVHVDVEGARYLFKAAQEAGVGRILFVSTMAAFEGCKSMYGKAKLLIENEAISRGGVAIRPGLMWGGGPGGLVDSLRAMATKSTRVPVFNGGGQVLYLNHRADLSDFVARFALGEIDAQGAFTLACDAPWTFKDILQRIALASGRGVSFHSLPWKPVYWLMQTLERGGIKPPFRSDSLLSLVNQDPSPDFSTYRRLGLAFRDFEPEDVE